MVWTAGSALACETKGGAARLVCCSIAPVSDHGGCCDASRPPVPARAASHADAPGDSVAPLILEPASSSCECRVSEPASPAEHQSRTSTERFEAEGHGLPVGVAPAMDQPPHIDRSTLRNESPSAIPLYLQTSRLLI